MIFKRKILLTKLNQVTRLYCQKSSQLKDLQNDKPKYAGYSPSNIENADITQCRPDGHRNERFSMIFPPPNITGNLHLGHVLTATIQDVIIRWKRMQGFDTKWIFGTDHAGIATQVVVEKIIQKKFGKSRHELGRENFLKEIWKWKHEKKLSIKKDLRKLGSTFDWSEEYFTLDPHLTDSVNEAFVRLFEKKLILRDNSLVNWSCALESAISDVEVENLEIKGKTQIVVPKYDRNVTVGILTDFAYKFVDSDEEIVVSTTRLETMLGDTAVAVNPKDPRYAHLRNKTLRHPYRNDQIPLIFDDSVDMEFGTGAVKITPSHDRNDFEVARRHNLSYKQVISENGCIIDGFGKFSRLHRFDARQKILDDLAVLRLFKETKDHNMILPICSRSKDIVEFMIKPQWFLKSSILSQKAAKAVENGDIKIIPQSFEKEWFRWLRNCRDWCISRQLNWGHQIPAYRFSNGKDEFWIAAKSEKEAKIKFAEKFPHLDNNFLVSRDQDVLDTWFSSGLLPFSVFNWPNESNENLKKYFPLSLMETGHDILFFWVARMVMLSIELTGQVPFKEILLHGIVCDSFGRKMSKSLGNVILPDQVIKGATLEELRNETEMAVEKGILNSSELEKSILGQIKMFPNGINECGVDALRFTLCSQNTKQHVINFDVNECVTNKLFLNKIWQATKYALNYADSKSIYVRDLEDIGVVKLSTMDKWILSRLGNTVNIVKKSLNDYNFHLSTSALKSFFYNNFCDVYLETTKNNLKQQNTGISSAYILNLCLSEGLTYLEIFTPYLAKELKQYLPKKTSFDPERYINDTLEKQINELLEVCSNIRETKSRLKLTKKHKCLIVIFIQDLDYENIFKDNLKDIMHLTFSENMKITTDSRKFESQKFDVKSTANHACSFGIELVKSNDLAKSSEEIMNKMKREKLENELSNMLLTVQKEGYKEKASEKAQQKHREKIMKLEMEIKNIKKLNKT